MNTSISVSIVTSVVSPSPQISQSGPTTTNSTDHPSSETTTNPSTQKPSDEDSIVTNVNSIVGIVVALSIAFCILFVGVLYICCRARRSRRQSRVIKTYGQDFSDPSDDMNKTPILVKKLPIIQEPSTAKVNRPTRYPTHSTATSVSRYSTIINQIGPSLNNAIPENRLAKNKKYSYF